MAEKTPPIGENIPIGPEPGSKEERISDIKQKIVKIKKKIEANSAMMEAGKKLLESEPPEKRENSKIALMVKNYQAEILELKRKLSRLERTLSGLNEPELF